MRVVFGAVLLLLLSTPPASSQVDRLLEGLGSGRQSDLSDSKITSGLKEALKVGTENAVRSTGRKDGYFRNEAIKIQMPRNLRVLDQPLRAAGFGRQIDAFVLSMNRAAERSVPYAKQIFWDAVAQMGFDDARKILNGGDTAATEYFQDKTGGALSEAFRPIVEKSMEEHDVTKRYKRLVKQYESVPLTKKAIVFHVDDYVVEQTLEGLFYVLGQEERKIRKNPSARATALLKEVFAK